MKEVVATVSVIFFGFLAMGSALMILWQTCKGLGICK